MQITSSRSDESTSAGFSVAECAGEKQALKRKKY